MTAIWIVRHSGAERLAEGVAEVGVERHGAPQHVHDRASTKTTATRDGRGPRSAE